MYFSWGQILYVGINLLDSRHHTLIAQAVEPFDNCFFDILPFLHWLKRDPCGSSELYLPQVGSVLVMSLNQAVSSISQVNPSKVGGPHFCPYVDQYLIGCHGLS